MKIDDQIRRYYAFLGKAQDMVDSRGRIYAEKCEFGHTIRHWKPTEEIWVCGHCPGSKPWPYEDHFIPKGIIQASLRPGEMEERLAGLAGFGYELEKMLRDSFWRWDTQALVAFALTGGPKRVIAEFANTYDWKSRSGKDWTKAMVDNSIRAARKELRARLNT